MHQDYEREEDEGFAVNPSGSSLKNNIIISRKNKVGEIAKAVNKYSVAENNVIGGGNMGFLLMHDLNYGLEDITVQNNFVDTSKKFINSYKLDKNVRWSSHSKGNLVVRNNYTSLNSKWKKNREMIIENAGRRSK